jgi:hypothetical protein
VAAGADLRLTLGLDGELQPPAAQGDGSPLLRISLRIRHTTAD